ncbi:hypothetical protein H5410_002251 [Solanum commersonii]|uniref:Uncharacterized protein n=1 Tax=Solanum commersonii TaxID=4109 RepID=A0A9J6B1D3_SOLCO|nr:hypothetical protein H5410_002251 [Solanum commersonii]
MFVSTRFSCFQNVRTNWPHIVEILEGAQHKYSYKIVIWLPSSWLVQIDGDTLRVKHKILPLSTNLVAELVTIRERKFGGAKSMVKKAEAISSQLKHTLREGNTLTEFFPNLVVKFAGTYLVEIF